MGKKWDSDKGGVEEWITWLSSVLSECRRVQKPGGALLCWSIPRTSHWTGMAIERAGYRIIDVVVHCHSQGFPKSLDISKAMDRMRDDSLYHVTAFVAAARDRVGCTNKDIDELFGFSGMAGHWTSSKSQPAIPTWEQWLELKKFLNFSDDMDMEVWRLNGRKGQPGDNWDKRELISERIMVQGGGNSLQIRMGERREVEANITAPATDEAKLWQGWGTGLAPSVEFWWLAYNPREGTYCQNALRYGVAGLNIDGARILRNGEESGYPSDLILQHHPECVKVGTRNVRGNRCAGSGESSFFGLGDSNGIDYVDENGLETIEDWRCHPSCPVRVIGEQSGISGSGKQRRLIRKRKAHKLDECFGVANAPDNYGDTGTAARFFLNLPPDEPLIRYQAKPSPREKNEGLEGMEERHAPKGNYIGRDMNNPKNHLGGLQGSKMQNFHPTTKSLQLMRYLVKLTKTPTGGVVLDPFMGSGTTGVACVAEGRDFHGIEMDAEYFEIAQARIEHEQGKCKQLELL